MELREALSQITQIRQQMAQSEVFRGYRSITVGFSGVLGLLASFAKRAGEPPEVLYSLGDTEKSLKSRILGTISTKNGPGIPSPRPGGPPKTIRWLVFASEAICVGAAMLVLISVFQIPGYKKQLVLNPFSAFVTSFDFVVQFAKQLL